MLADVDFGLLGKSVARERARIHSCVNLLAIGDQGVPGKRIVVLLIYLAAVAVLPSLFIRYGGFSQATSRALGGTSVLIVVGVALDTMRQMESQMMMRSYEGFLK